jgi:hypothetical protein
VNTLQAPHYRKTRRGSILRKDKLGILLAGSVIGRRKMSFQLQMEQMPGYLAARFIGVGLRGEASQQFQLIAERCKLTNNDKLLIDSTRYDVDVKISLVDRFLLGERLGIFARYGIKVGFFSRPEQLDPRRFAVVVAQNRGVKVETFTDLQDAEEWLLK